MRTLRSLVAVLGVSLAPGLLTAQGDCAAPAAGPDVIVGSLNGISNYGGTGGISAFSLGTTSCNIGTAELDWIAADNRHPVIAQNIYRLAGGRFEQLGQSWLKHGFGALQLGLCCPCTPAGSLQALGVGCSDPYTSGLNGLQSNLGPRSEVDPHTGLFPFPFTGVGMSGDVLFRRIQVPNDDLDPALNPGALYFGEGHYVAMDDALAGNGNNNASYRPMLVGPPSGGGWTMALTGSTARQQPAIQAWQDFVPSVHIEPVQVPGDGLFLVGSDVTYNGDGTWRYEYAVQNLNNSRSGGSFSVPVPATLTVTNVGFHDVDYHSGEPYDGTDWGGVRGTDDVTWTTGQDFATNPDANALRWGTTYNFRFDANGPPVAALVSATLGLFAPHTPSTVAADVKGPEFCAPGAATEATRLGMPPNPSALLTGLTSGPIVGATWDPIIDHSSFVPAAVLDVLAVNADGVQVNVPTASGTLLCNVPAPQFFFFAAAGSAFSVPVPGGCQLVGLAVCAQALSFDGLGGFELTNALDLTVGNQ